MLDQVQYAEQYLCGCFQAPLFIRSESSFYVYYEDSDRYRYRLHKPTNVVYIQNKQTSEWECYATLDDM